MEMTTATDATPPGDAGWKFREREREREVTTY
jgi:hypothetical protein